MMNTNSIQRRHKRIQELEYEIIYAEGTGDKQYIDSLHKERKTIQEELDEFYSDPITESISL